LRRVNLILSEFGIKSKAKQDLLIIFRRAQHHSGCLRHAPVLDRLRPCEFLCRTITPAAVLRTRWIRAHKAAWRYIVAGMIHDNRTCQYADTRAFSKFFAAHRIDTHLDPTECWRG